MHLLILLVLFSLSTLQISTHSANSTCFYVFQTICMILQIAQTFTRDIAKLRQYSVASALKLNLRATECSYQARKIYREKTCIIISLNALESCQCFHTPLYSCLRSFQMRHAPTWFYFLFLITTRVKNRDRSHEKNCIPHITLQRIGANAADINTERCR